MGRTLGILALCLAVSSPAAAQRIHLESGALPVWRPVLDSAAAVPCVWPTINTGNWHTATAADGTLSLRVPAARRARGERPPPDGGPWRLGRGTLEITRGSTDELSTPSGPWTRLVPMHMIDGRELSTSECNDCLQIETRCQSVVAGRRVWVAFGQEDGGWGDTDYEVLAAIPDGPDYWIVLHGKGPERETVALTLAVVRSIGFR
jgi:hypothetical protein